MNTTGRRYLSGEALRIKDLNRALQAIHDMAAQGIRPSLLQSAAWIAIERDAWAERQDRAERARRVSA